MKHFVKITLLFLASISWQACVDHSFDEPIIVEDVIPFAPNSSIAALKALHQTGKFVDISSDLLIHAVVVADDKSGNFYKTIVVQDSTAGIEIKINQTGLSRVYPIGMKIGIKCKGLTISDYNGLIQLGQGNFKDGTTQRLAGIESAVLFDHLYRGPKNQHITPKIVPIPLLGQQHISTLVMLENVEFSRAEVGTTYADPVGQVTMNKTLVDCQDNELILRNSGFADFAGEIIPEQNGNITGIFGVFGRDLQLFLRDIRDVNLTKAPCNGGGGGGTLELKTIREVRNLFSGATTTVSAPIKIQGIVISDKDNNNLVAQNLYVQDATAGIVVRFAASSHSYAIGDEVEVSASGIELSEFNGLLQLNNVPLTNAKKLSSGKSVIPKLLTLAEANARVEELESQLVKIQNATLSKSSGSDWNGSVTIDDGTGNTIIFTRSQASFSSNAFPTGKVHVTGIISQFNTKQLLIRNLSDVETAGGGGGGGTELKSIADIRALYSGTKLNIAGDFKIKGIVTSDKDAINIQGQNMFVQDASGAIMVRIAAVHSYAMGDEIEVIVKGVELSEFNNLLQLNNTPVINVSKISSGNVVTPKTITVADLLANFESMESQLVRVVGATLTNASNTYNGTSKLDDGTGVIDMFTRSQATFAATAIPATKVNVVGQVSQFGTTSRQIVIRNLSDITQ